MPKQVFDIIKGNDGDLFLQDGDLVIGESTGQHQEDLLMSAMGLYRDAQLVGVDIVSWLLEDEDYMSLQNVIQTQWERDGLSITLMDLSQLPKLIIKANYV